MNHKGDFNDFLMTLWRGMFHPVKIIRPVKQNSFLFSFLLFFLLTVRKLQHVVKTLKNGSVV